MLQKIGRWIQTFPWKKGLNWCNSSLLDVEGQNEPYGNHFRPIQVTQSLSGNPSGAPKLCYSIIKLNNQN